MNRGAAAAIATVALAFVGCRRVLDVDGFGTRPSPDAAAPVYMGSVDGYSYTSAACRDCVDEHCDAAAAACSGDPACSARARCLAACEAKDHSCRGICAVSTPGSPALAALVACEAAHCEQCAASLAVRGGAQCDSCLADRCGPLLADFSIDSKALAYAQCSLDCTCQGDCPGGAPGCSCAEDAAAQQLVEELAACCPAQCSTESPDWSCIGHIQSVRLPSRTSTLELQMQVVTPGGVGVPALHVQACSPIEGAGANCAASSSGTTGADGWISLTIPRPPFGELYFSHLHLTSDDLAFSAPALFYFFPPLAATPARVSRRMVSRGLADSILETNDLGIVPDWDSNGGVVFSARSCNGNGRGIRLTAPHGDRVLYFDDRSALVPDATATVSEDGIGFIANVTPGRHELEARRAATNELLGQYSVLVMAGSLTHIALNPTPIRGD